MKVFRAFLWLIIVVCLVVTWLPYFNILNSSIFWGGFPQPLALTFICNVILTVCNVLIYWAYFCPFQKAIDKETFN